MDGEWEAREAKKVCLKARIILDGFKKPHLKVKYAPATERITTVGIPQTILLML